MRENADGNMLSRLLAGVDGFVHDTSADAVLGSKKAETFVEAKIQKRRKAEYQVKRKVRGWDRHVSVARLADQQQFGVKKLNRAERSQKSAQVNEKKLMEQRAVSRRKRPAVEVMRSSSSSDSEELLAALGVSLPEETVSASAVFRPHPEVKAADDARQLAIARQKVKRALFIAQGKNAMKKRQKGKRARRDAKREDRKQAEALLAQVEDDHPEQFEAILNDFEEDRSRLRSMTGHAKRRKWAKAATRYGASKLVADDAARTDLTKTNLKDNIKSVKARQEKLTENESDGSMEVEFSGYSSGDEESSGSDVSSASDDQENLDLRDSVEDSEHSAASEEPVQPERVNADPTAADIRLSKVEAKDLSTVIYDEGENKDQLVDAGIQADMVVDEAIDELVERDDDLREEINKVDEDFGMPGWGGDWVGDDFKELTKKSEARKQDKRAESRANVLARPLKIRKNVAQMYSKYFCAKLPAKNKGNVHSYNLAMATPDGPEWNSIASTDTKTKPKVFVESGSVIQPLSKALETKNVEEVESILSRWKVAGRKNRIKAKM